MQSNPQKNPVITTKLSSWQRCVVWGATILFTLWALSWSARNGRLAQDPTFDDVGYFIDAAERLQVFEQKGFFALFENFFYNHLHAPFSTILALISFEVLGLHDWAPYVFNGFVIAAYLFLCSRIFGDLRKTAFVSLLLFCLTIPFALRAVHDFRPDFASALATAFFVWFGLASVSPDRAHAKKFSLIAGITFGAALWLKPTLFPHTLAVAGLTGAMMAFNGFFPVFVKRPFAQAFGDALRFGLSGVIVALPYYLFNGSKIIGYIVHNTQGEDAHIGNFQPDVSMWSVLYSFTIRGAQATTFGKFIWPLLACALIGLVWAILNRHRFVSLQIAGLLTASAGSLSVFVIGRHNNEYFGFTFQILILLAGLTALAAVIRQRPFFTFLAPALLLFCLTPIFFTHLGSFWTPATEAATQTGWNSRVVHAITSDSGISPDRFNKNPLPVFVGFAGSINSVSMQWVSMKEYLPLAFSDLHRSGDTEAQLEAARKSAYVVVCTSSAKSVFSTLPSGETFGKVQEALSTDPNFQEISMGSEKDLPYRVFRNNPVLKEAATKFSVSIGWPSMGFLPSEGPYPDWNLPEIRWGLFPSSSITVSSTKNAKALFNLSVSAPPESVIQIKLDGKTIGEHVQKTPAYEASEIPLALHPGENQIELEYNLKGPAPHAGDRAVLFKDLRITLAP